MFYKCYKLKKIKGINTFNTSKVTNKEGIFTECNELKFLDGFNNDLNYNYNKNLKNQLNEEKNRNQQLLDELNKERKRNKGLTGDFEEINATNFRTSDQLINYPIAGKSTDNFSQLEEKLFHEFPDLRNKNIYFIANGNIINRDATLEENKIKSGTTILIQYM